MTTEQRYAAAERVLELQKARRVRRAPVLVIAVLGLMVLLVGLTAVVDLRRLQTPRGAALAWAEAATFGHCRAYLSLSQPVDAGAERRSDDAICRALQARTAGARSKAAQLAITALGVHRDGRSATVDVRVGSVAARLTLVHRGARWLVLRDAVACASVGCP